MEILDLMQRALDKTNDPDSIFALDRGITEIERMREALQNIASKNPFHNQCPPAGDTNYYGKLIAEMIVIANAALKEKE